MRVELEERIERQKLDACALVQDVAGNACEDLLHHAVRAVIAIVVGLTEQKATGVHQAVIDRPGIDANAVQRSRHLARFAQPCEDFIPQTQNIPKAVPVQRHRSIGKPVCLFQAQASPIKARQHHTPALGSQIDCCHVACRHESYPFLSVDTPQLRRHRH